MKRFLQIAVALFLVTSVAQAMEIIANGVKMDATIIDVRTVDEFAAGHIDGALNIPVEKLMAEIHSVDGLRKDGQILLYCRTGRRSAIARDIMGKLGFRNIQDGGGMDALLKKMKTISASPSGSETHS